MRRRGRRRKRILLARRERARRFPGGATRMAGMLEGTMLWFEYDESKWNKASLAEATEYLKDLSDQVRNQYAILTPPIAGAR